MTSGWNFADVWEAVADRFPDAPAQRFGTTTTSWSAFDRRAESVATTYRSVGLAHQSKVAQLLFNGPEYLESVFGALKIGSVPVNVNYRYTGEELWYLLDNADAEAVVFHSSLTRACEEVRQRLPRVRLWLWVDDDGGGCPDWALPYGEAADTATGRQLTTRPRSGADLILVYTGGTTGKPKGVMWPQDAMFRMLEQLNGRPAASDADPVEYAANLDRPGPRVLPAAPLMHGTAMWFAMPALNQGGCVVTMVRHTFDPVDLLDTVQSDEVKGLGIVGDAFARPIVAALQAEPQRWDLSKLRVVFSSGVTFSAETKAALLAFAPRAVVVDSLGSSESGGLARTQTSAQGTATVATGAGSAGAGNAGGLPQESGTFSVGSSTRVVDETGRDVEPGSGQRGRLAISGHIPIGYYGDPVKTAETFATIDGVVHVIAGDWAQVDADGTIRLLGRGSACINTGGEKVYPDEVEMAVKRAVGVRDAVVVGVADERFGEAVTAVVEPEPGATVDLRTVAAEVRRTLAAYKAPRHLVLLPSLGRAANGKADYSRLQALAEQAVAADPGNPTVQAATELGVAGQATDGDRPNATSVTGRHRTEV